MKFLEIEDPCEVLPISCRLLQLFGLGRGDKFKWFFWIQCAFYVPFNIVTRFMADFDTTIALFRNGSEILFVALMFSQIIAFFYNLDIRHNLVHYTIYIIAIGMLAITGSLSLCTKDVVDFGTIRTTALMFEMLAMQIRELPRQITQHHLKTIIDSHQTVLQCFRKLQQSLSLALLIQLAFFSAVWCFILVYILLMGLNTEVLNLCIYLIIITVETYSYCSLCTELSTKGNEILLALQELPWYEQPVKIQQQILLMIRRSQVSTVLTAGKLVSVNIALFSSMIQKTYSLYLIMKDIF
ncbi:uncharacterized protein LOC126577310 [Anopheles aquasalis]|uniref:uncharacterized protein LOC126577310 n=1 Tax=Anopheles aquasalis TaxID=42839 RepID=UPI00215A69EA|nr:uncharacterized protein LOC126577310 [Anopheles aquasalis]